MNEEFFKSKADKLGVDKLPIVDLQEETMHFQRQEPKIVQQGPPADATQEERQ